MGETAPAFADWLALREPADAAARSEELVAELVATLPGGRLVVHDLGCGTGSMARWLAPRLPGPQRWVLHDRDGALLRLAAASRVVDGREARVAIETRRGDITRLEPDVLADANLVTASALLDTFTADEVARFVATCAAAGCPVLVALSVTGRVELTPSDPFDTRVADAFNAHQRRTTPAGALLGPAAVDAAVAAFAAAGAAVTTRPSAWQLGAADAALVTAWFGGWVGAAVEQRPDLAAAAEAYAARRQADVAAGRLAVTVHHLDLLALPR
ncbi:class I SAM-dependent methyltransferase [Cellulomonas alba]|uniref:Class I SAM-dependent methyltransferase n=1 Tax=Cellulomonas alba TaxID=3053467 RepID=A0ABT7SJA4_9CELL|nr:class I SAM-dependent methyltransferase [Cellulomonas alba]MDM7856270.1 class I SAM-dependent methyltransferase [Cellulomonas alba]